MGARALHEMLGGNQFTSSRTLLGKQRSREEPRRSHAAISATTLAKATSKYRLMLVASACRGNPLWLPVRKGRHGSLPLQNREKHDDLPNTGSLAYRYGDRCGPHCNLYRTTRAGRTQNIMHRLRDIVA